MTGRRGFLSGLDIFNIALAAGFGNFPLFPGARVEGIQVAEEIEYEQ